MSLKHYAVALCCTIAICVAAAPATYAASLTVWNPGFELPAQTDGNFTTNVTYANQGGYGWNGTLGIWNPNGSQFNGAAGNGTPQGGEGSQVGYLFNFAGLGITTQTLAGADGIVGNADDPLLSANTLYTMTVAVGQRMNAIWGGYDLRLLAGSTVIAEETNAFIPTPGTLADRSIQVDSRTLSSALYGSALTLSLSSLIGSGTVEFDNVRVTAVAVPEPGTLSLLGVASACLAAAMIRRRRARRLSS